MTLLEPEKKDSPLVQAVKAEGGQSIPEEFGTTKTYKQAIGDGKISFFPELPRIAWESLVGQKFIIKGIKIVEDFDSHFGTSDFPLLRIKLEDGREGTTLGSGIAILKQSRNLLNKRMIPVVVTLTKIPTGQGDYYSFS